MEDVIDRFHNSLYKKIAAIFGIVNGSNEIVKLEGFFQLFLKEHLQFIFFESDDANNLRQEFYSLYKNFYEKNLMPNLDENLNEAFYSFIDSADFKVTYKNALKITLFLYHSPQKLTLGISPYNERKYNILKLPKDFDQDKYEISLYK